MKKSTISIPKNIIFGENSVQKAALLLRVMNMEQVLVISGPHLHKSGLTKKLTEALSKSSISYTLFTDIEANPSIETVEKATRAFENSKSTAIIALGGGSPMDVGKLVSVLGKYGGKVTDYEGANKVPGKALPFIAIPTTAGSASEVTPFSVITDTSKNYKLTVYSDELIPIYAILDPTLLESLPKSVAAATGMDAMIHAIEAYLSTAASPESDGMALEALTYIGKSLRTFVADRGNTDAATDMLLGSMFAGLAFSKARLGNIHAMSHPVSGFFHVPHGVANTILLPTVLEYNLPVAKEKYQAIYNAISIDETPYKEPEDLIREIHSYMTCFEIPKSLKEVGVKEEAIEAMAIDAMKSGNISVNPRPTKQADIELLYAKTM